MKFLQAPPVVETWPTYVLWGSLGAVGLALLIAVWHQWQQRQARKEGLLDPLQLEELLLGAPPQIIDLRRPREFSGHHGHIRGALNIPLEDLPRRLFELDTTHPRPIVLVDDGDGRSKEAARLLRREGIAWLYILRGGMRAWRKAGMVVSIPPTRK